MITGLPPFYSRNRETMFQKIMTASLGTMTYRHSHALIYINLTYKYLYDYIRLPCAHVGDGSQPAGQFAGARPQDASRQWREGRRRDQGMLVLDGLGNYVHKGLIIFSCLNFYTTSCKQAHPFFSDMDWPLLSSGKMPPPWIPRIASSLDTSQFDSEFTSMLPIVSPDVRDAYFGSLDKVRSCVLSNFILYIVCV